MVGVRYAKEGGRMVQEKLIKVTKGFLDHFGQRKQARDTGSAKTIANQSEIGKLLLGGKRVVYEDTQKF
jgi:hypothetical protein